MSAIPTRKMSPTEYLAWEREQKDKHQYLGGEVLAMAGASPRHNHLAANVLGELYGTHRGSECGSFTSNQRIFIPSTGNYVYPDVVVCGPIELQSGTRDVMLNPRVIVEVLSSSTENHDRGDKWADYRSVASLTDYVLVSQRRPAVEHFARQSDGTWTYRAAGRGGRIELSTGAVLEVDAIYAAAMEVPGDE
jgi:Uma2 family endonuclease